LFRPSVIESQLWILMVEFSLVDYQLHELHETHRNSTLQDKIDYETLTWCCKFPSSTALNPLTRAYQ
jgi:hypothetical protein